MYINECEQFVYSDVRRRKSRYSAIIAGVCLRDNITTMCTGDKYYYFQQMAPQTKTERRTYRFLCLLVLRMSMTANRKTFCIFTKKEDEMLIEFVSHHVALFDMSLKQYKYILKEELMWKEIDDIINKSGRFHYITLLNYNLRIIQFCTTWFIMNQIQWSINIWDHEWVLMWSLVPLHSSFLTTEMVLKLFAHVESF